MAQGDYKLIKEGSWGIFEEKTVSAESGKVLGFDSQLDPTMYELSGEVAKHGNEAHTETYIIEGDPRLSDDRTPTSHTHGSITNDGKVTTAVTVANTDRILITDASDSSIVKAGTTFGTSSTQYLRNNGSWGTPPNTTYSEISTAEIDAGTSATNRTITGRRIGYLKGLMAAADHNHSGVYEPEIGTKGTAFNKDFGSAADTVTEGNDSRLSDAREPTSHGNEKHSTNYEPELNADQKRKITYGTADPTGGSDGDIYLQYED